MNKLEKLQEFTVSEISGIIRKIGLNNFSVHGYPFHENFGDHLLYLSMRAMLFTLGQINYCSSNPGNFIPQKNELIVSIGGGHVGDIWKHEMDRKLFLIHNYKNNPILFFPQSAFFTSKEYLNQCKELIKIHGNVHMIAREQTTYKFFLEHFNEEHCYLTPDIALSYTVYFDFFQKTSDKLLIARDDLEKKVNIELENCDRIEKSFGIPFNNNLNMSFAYINMIVNIFSQYKEIYTDRLHYHILAILLGKKNYFYENSYFKNNAFYNSWTKDLGLTEFIENSQL